MSFWKRKKRAEGQGIEELTALEKEFEVLNRTPLDYRYTQEHIRLMNQAEELFRKKVQQIPIDDMCDDMLDYSVDADTVAGKASAREQYCYHLGIIDHHRGILEGELLCAKEHMENLRQDLAWIEEEIRICQQQKKEKGIY